MRHNYSYDSFATTVKFINSFFGVLIIIYSRWMLDEYNCCVSVPQTANLPDSWSSGMAIGRVSEPLKINHVDSMTSLSCDHPAPPWFIFSFMVVGILACTFTFIGFKSVESISRLNLILYYYVLLLLILLESALVAFIAFDRSHSKKDLLDRAFIEDNILICKWVGLFVIALQKLSLLLSLFHEEEEDYDYSTIWSPLLCTIQKQALLREARRSSRLNIIKALFN